MLEWIFKPLFQTTTCHGANPTELVCYDEPFGVSPIILIIIGVFFGYLSLATFIKKYKDKKLEKWNNE